MSLIGLEFCDAGLQVARGTDSGPEVVDLGGGETGWPAVACQDTDGFRFGPEAEGTVQRHLARPDARRGDAGCAMCCLTQGAEVCWANSSSHNRRR